MISDDWKNSWSPIDPVTKEQFAVLVDQYWAEAKNLERCERVLLAHPRDADRLNLALAELLGRRYVPPEDVDLLARISGVAHGKLTFDEAKWPTAVTTALRAPNRAERRAAMRRR